ncbi:hypothetical protein BJX66DRAFT_317208 [Aspergillus keveii]|uniref:GPI anchored protein n=1 Tax=Aspergillus keveii TaxID=714993 RepID=A0ABR4FLJ6_9EURO
MRAPNFLLLCALSGLLHAFGTFAQRRGGGHSDSDSDSSSNSNSNNDEDSSDSSSPSSSGPYCDTPINPPPNIEVNLIPDNGDNRNYRGVSNYDGSFFYGEAWLGYEILETTGIDTCNSSAENPIRLLGYAWMGPQSEEPAGPTNPYIIGFQAWESKEAVEDINTSYDYVMWDPNEKWCPEEPDLFLVRTTHSWRGSASEPGGELPIVAADVIDMEFAADEQNPTAVSFNGTMPDVITPEPRNEGFPFRLLGLPGRICTDERVYWIEDNVDRLGLSGSVTNATLDLVLTGRGVAVPYRNNVAHNLTVEFNVTFSGRFDTANSTERPDIRQAEEALITWVGNSGVRGAPPLGWVGSSCFTALLSLLLVV